MIGRLTGTLSSATPEGLVVLEVHGVGYLVRVPLLALPALENSIEPVSLCIHTAVREDAIDLYGFPAETDLSLFKQLMSVSGIGPKTALSIMSIADTHSLRTAIAQGDAAALVKVFGIGKKSAERIVVELRDKMFGAGAAPQVQASGEVLEALMSLGYSAAEARSALKDVAVEGSVHERLAAALRQLGKRSNV